MFPSCWLKCSVFVLEKFNYVVILKAVTFVVLLNCIVCLRDVILFIASSPNANVVNRGEQGIITSQTTAYRMTIKLNQTPLKTVSHETEQPNN